MPPVFNLKAPQKQIQQRQKPTESPCFPSRPKSLYITVTLNADLCIFVGGNVMFLWQNLGSGEAQNLKNCLGYDSWVSSWVTPSSSSRMKLDSPSFFYSKTNSTFTTRTLLVTRPVLSDRRPAFAGLFSVPAVATDWNCMFAHWSSEIWPPRIQEPLWSVFPSFSVIFLNYTIKGRCLARSERAVKREKQWENEQRSHLIESIFLSFGNRPLGKHLSCLCANTFIIAAPHWKFFIPFFSFFIDQWEAELGQPGANMAHLRFSYARSRSKCKNPIPSQTQKRLLSKGGPPEVTVARLHPWTLLMTLSKRHEGGGGEEGRGCLCSCCRGTNTSFSRCAASTYLRKKCLQSVRTLLTRRSLTRSRFRWCKTAKWCSGAMPAASRSDPRRFPSESRRARLWWYLQLKGAFIVILFVVFLPRLSH